MLSLLSFSRALKRNRWMMVWKTRTLKWTLTRICSMYGDGYLDHRRHTDTYIYPSLPPSLSLSSFFLSLFLSFSLYVQTLFLYAHAFSLFITLSTVFFPCFVVRFTSSSLWCSAVGCALELPLIGRPTASPFVCVHQILFV